MGIIHYCGVLLFSVLCALLSIVLVVQVTELAAREQALRLERAEERYRRAQAQCEEDMKWIEERKTKVRCMLRRCYCSTVSRQ